MDQMGNWVQGRKNLLREAFQILTITLLSLLLPLSFLLLARLSIAHFLLLAFTPSPPLPSSLLFSLFLNTNPLLILQPIVSLVSVASLFHALSSGKITPIPHPIKPVFQSRLYTAWIALCTLQVCVGLGIEGSIAAGISASGFGRERSLLSRAFFFLGLHETMLYWSRKAVKPVVDDTVFGFAREERWVERMAMATSFGGLWWWRLRDEVESLVVVAEVKREMEMSVGVADFVGWWLYYLTVTIGMVRVVKGIIWVGLILLCRRVPVEEDNPSHSHDNGDKV